MSAGYLLDTNVVIDVLRAPPGSTFAVSLERPTYVSTLTFAELRSGTVAARGLEQQRRLSDFTLARRTWPRALPVDETVVEAYGAVCAAVLAGGAKPRVRVVDGLLAATALAFDLDVVTANLGDFAHVTGLVQVVPFAVTPSDEPG